MTSLRTTKTETMQISTLITFAFLLLSCGGFILVEAGVTQDGSCYCNSRGQVVNTHDYQTKCNSGCKYINIYTTIHKDISRNFSLLILEGIMMSLLFWFKVRNNFVMMTFSHPESVLIHRFAFLHSKRNHVRQTDSIL